MFSIFVNNVNAGDYAFCQKPRSLTAPYKEKWGIHESSGRSIEATEDGFKILKSGHYEIFYEQRSRVDNGYGAIGIDGNRDILENDEGDKYMWTQDHADKMKFYHCRCMGFFAQNTLITAGSDRPELVEHDSQKYSGAFWIKRLK